MNNQKFNVTELDHDGILQNLRNYLSTQTEFTDYDFEGSGLSVLLHLLSYNTHIQAFYLNMLANEMFLDTASRRDSAVSIAKQLDYIPYSRTASTAVVNLTITPTGFSPPPKILLEKFSKFTTSVDGKTYTFVNEIPYSIDLDTTTNTYKGNNISLKEGVGFTFRYVVDSTQPQRFVIPNKNVDTKTITVKVQKSQQNTETQLYSLYKDINELNPTSLVYFLQENEDGRYEILFGDNILGKKPDELSVVIIDYIACNADTPNKASVFTSAGSIGGYSQIKVSTVLTAFGGTERESLESIKFTAPKNYEAQGRAITVADYKTILTQEYTNMDSIAVWGGEDNTPPIYGKVFISIKPKSGYILTQAAKNLIVQDILRKRNIITVIPELIDPDYLFIELDSKVKYDPRFSVYTSEDLKNLVFQSITNFSEQELSKFDQKFRYSRLTASIDKVDSSISNNLTNILLQKRIDLRLKTVQNITANFYSNALEPFTLTSNSVVIVDDPKFLYIPGDTFSLDDDGVGNVRLIRKNLVSSSVVNARQGTIDYDKGIVTISGLVVDSVEDGSSTFRIKAKPRESDVTPTRNVILLLDLLNVRLTIEAVV